MKSVPYSGKSYISFQLVVFLLQYYIGYGSFQHKVSIMVCFISNNSSQLMVSPIIFCIGRVTFRFSVSILEIAISYCNVQLVVSFSPVLNYAKIKLFNYRTYE